ncbi:hypothetical protein [Brachyspira murdochii]|uniref:Uncharacterized protein n=1 Tax=Brachyspira murdochii (strain ATCC 51284 / DSM 12563 / 56-150) TaxID=526224 RepID=D5U9S4_BRAM5|nr:hypothetical protein [Brachyspira murdochii]ADG71447.1 hypothetical protein Bmur_1357 [Brachyspira murdochii DSM 12563]
MYSNNTKEEKKLLNLALKHREELTQNDFNTIVSFCYSRIAQKQINNSIEKYIIPTYNKIIKRAIEK